MKNFKILASLLFLFNYIIANETVNEKEYKFDDFIKKTNDYRNEAYKQFIDSTKDIDNYLTDNYQENYQYDKNFILLETSIRKNQSEELQGEQRLKIRVFLPKFNEKYNVVFESEEENESDNLIEEKSEKINYDIAINFKKRTNTNFTISSKLGLRLARILDPFLSTNMKKSFLFDNEILSIIEKIKYSYTKRLESTSKLVYINKFDPKYSFVNSNEYYWNSTFEKVDNFHNVISLRELVDDKNSFSYNFSLSHDNKESSLKLKRYSYYLTHNYKIRNWLHFDTLLENFFREDLNFEPHYAVAFKLSFYIAKNQ